MEKGSLVDFDEDCKDYSQFTPFPGTIAIYDNDHDHFDQVSLEHALENFSFWKNNEQKMEGRVLKAFDIKELFLKYESEHLGALLHDAYRTFKKDLFCTGIEKGVLEFCMKNDPVVHLLRHLSIVQLEKFIPYIDQTIRLYETRDLNAYKGLVARIQGGQVLLILLRQIVAGEKIWDNKKELI